MNNKLPCLALVIALTLAMFVPTAKGVSIQSLGPGKMTYVLATIGGGPQTVDPALAYDTPSCELVRNVYDPLVFFEGTSSSEFVPWLATSWTVSPDGTTYSFVIRQNVPWQNSAYGFVAPGDVAYSLQKVLVRDYTGGPAWMLWFPIFGIYSATDFGDLTNPTVATALGNAIASAITHDDVAQTVTINFQTGKAYLPFLGILAQTWGSVESEQWCIDHGDWNPAVDRLSDGTWVNARDPATSPLDNPYVMMGSGPFEFNFLNAGVVWSIIRNGGEMADPTPSTTFWGGWGTSRGSLLGMLTTSRGYVDEVVEYFVSDYATRLAGFTGVTPIYDSIYVPRASIATVWQQPGVKCIYPLPSQAIDAMFFGFNVSMLSPYIGSPTSEAYFGENGIRPDFFSDIHARKAVAYSFNWTKYIASAWLSEAEQVGIPLPTTLPFYDGSQALRYGIDISQAISEWQLAWGGQVWANGFYFDVVYNAGNTARQTAAQILKAALEAENPKFHVSLVDVPSNAYNTALRGGPGGRALAPIFISGWLTDFPDADDWVVPFMQSTAGTFAYPQHVDMDPQSGLIDNLIKNGAYNATVAGRDANYQALWQLYHEEALSLPLEQPLGRRWARDWIHGWYYNPSFLSNIDGPVASYFYTIWKEDFTTSTGPFAGKHANWEDITEDGRVDIKDSSVIAKALGSYFLQPLLPPYPSAPGVVVTDVTSSNRTVIGQGFNASIDITVGNTGKAGEYTPNWNSRADVNVVDVGTGARGDMKVDEADSTAVAMLVGFIADPWTPYPSIIDASMTDAASSKTVADLSSCESTEVQESGLSVLAETFSVNVYADLAPPIGDEILIGTLAVGNLAVGETSAFVVIWNTTVAMPKGVYTISVVITTTGNSLSLSNITLAMFGDLSGPTVGVPDGKCDIRDLAAANVYYGQDSPPAPANYDINGPTYGRPDGKIDIRDLALINTRYGLIDP